jgi:hypothetical protein
MSPAQAGGHGDEAFRALRKQIFVDARLAVEAFEVPGRDQIDEVAIAVLILAEQHLVVVAVGAGAALVAFLGDVHFAADDRWIPVALAVL